MFENMYLLIKARKETKNPSRQVVQGMDSFIIENSRGNSVHHRGKGGNYSIICMLTLG